MEEYEKELSLKTSQDEKILINSLINRINGVTSRKVLEKEDNYKIIIYTVDDSENPFEKLEKMLDIHSKVKSFDIES